MEERDQLQEMLNLPKIAPEARTKIVSQIAAIDRFVDGKEETSVTGDPLADIWEAQMAAGLEPDFNLTIEDLKRGESRNQK